jgi:hypothetical protein
VQAFFMLAKVCTHCSPVRERERGGGREGERERVKEVGGESEKEGERDVQYFQNCYFYF